MSNCALNTVVVDEQQTRDYWRLTAFPELKAVMELQDRLRQAEIASQRRQALLSRSTPFGLD